MSARRHAKFRAGIVAVAAVLVVVAGAPVSAQESERTSRAVALDQWRPSPIQRTSLLAVQTSAVLPHATPSVGVVVHGTDDPLVALGDPDGERRIIKLVDERLHAELGVGIGLFDTFALGLSLPLVYQRGSALVDRTGRTEPLPGWTFGDLQIAPRWQIVAPSGLGSVGVSVGTRVYAPLGDASSYNSAGAFRVEPRATLDWRPFAGTVIALDIGWQLRPRRVLADRFSDDTLTAGLGLHFPVGVWGIDGIANAVGELPVAPGAEENATAEPYLEILGGLRADLTERVAVQIAGGSGLTSAVGSPDVRLALGVEYAPVALDADDDRVPDFEDPCPEQREDLDGHRDEDGCPDPDNDGDGNPDDGDNCPMEVEDPDGFEDDDGCPDPDNDGDGIPDATDACPQENGIRRKNGCPFVDSDGDGIDDTVDANPNAAEDVDGYRDDDGAPDPDNDGDGIPDDADECPTEPETVNGVDDEDGCPDEGDAGVTVSKGKIEIDERVHFDTDRATIKQRSYSILEEVAAALKANREIRKVRIEGHTDAKGDDLYNLALSQRRANAVREFLIEREVDPSRLESKGYGESEPIATNETEEGRRENRRVEITILEVEEK